jgi:hypothetical protein
MKLAQVIRDYVDLKQAMGARVHSEAVILKAFCRNVGNIAIAEVTAEQANAYLAGHGPGTRFWQRKLSVLQGFYRFAIGRGYVTRSPLPATTPTLRVVFTPSISSPEELRRLLQAVDACEHPRSMLSANDGAYPCTPVVWGGLTHQRSAHAETRRCPYRREEYPLKAGHFVVSTA